MRENPNSTSWTKGITAQLELLKKEKEKQAALERTIQDECRRLEILLGPEENPLAARLGLKELKDKFEEMFRQPKTPDRIVVPNPTNPSEESEGIRVDALIVSRTAQGSLVALFKSLTPLAEFHLYGGLSDEKQENANARLYTPLRNPRLTHQEIYKNRKPDVQRRILSATMRAMYERAAQLNYL